MTGLVVATPDELIAINRGLNRRMEIDPCDDSKLIDVFPYGRPVEGVVSVGASKILRVANKDRVLTIGNGGDRGYCVFPKRGEGRGGLMTFLNHAEVELVLGERLHSVAYTNAMLAACVFDLDEGSVNAYVLGPELSEGVLKFSEFYDGSEKTFVSPDISLVSVQYYRILEDVHERLGVENIGEDMLKGLVANANSSVGTD
jgi:hypothetical protein